MSSNKIAQTQYFSKKHSRKRGSRRRSWAEARAVKLMWADDVSLFDGLSLSPEDHARYMADLLRQPPPPLPEPTGALVDRIKAHEREMTRRMEALNEDAPHLFRSF